MNRAIVRSIVVLTLSVALGLWVAVAWIAKDPGRGWGPYWLELAALQAFVTYLAILFCYVISGHSLWKRRLARAVLSLVALTLAWAAAEAPALLGRLDYRTVFLPKTIGGLGPHNRQLDPELLWVRPSHDHFTERQPGDWAAGFAVADPHIYETEYRFDQHGFRNDKDPNDRDPQRADVVLLGDSFVEGYRVAQDKTCAVALSQEFNSDVVNLGRADYGPPQQLVVLKRYALPLRPRVVVWFVFVENDLSDLAEYERAIADWPAYVDQINRFSARCFTRNALDVLGTWLDSFRSEESDLARRRSGQWQSETLYFGFQPLQPTPERLEQLTRLEAILREADLLCRQNEVRLLVAYVPTKHAVYGDLCDFPPDGDVIHWQPSGLASHLGQSCQEAQIEYLDLTDSLKAAAADGKRVYLPDDGHWSPAGHAAVAKTLREYLDQEP